MLKVHDIRETRVYQEGVEEGEEKGIAIAIVKMAAKKMSVAEIAAILELDAAVVQHVIEGAASDRST
jgi:predicted transposase YdaD